MIAVTAVGGSAGTPLSVNAFGQQAGSCFHCCRPALCCRSGGGNSLVFALTLLIAAIGFAPVLWWLVVGNVLVLSVPLLGLPFRSIWQEPGCRCCSPSLRRAPIQLIEPVFGFSAISS